MSKPKEFSAIKNNTSVSWLADSYNISEENGVLAICKVNLVHAVILFEYLKPSSQHELQRSVIKIDFGPAHKKYSITGKGKAQFREYVGEDEIAENINNLIVGQFWFSNTKNVLEVFEKIKNEIDKGEKVPTYSSSGSGSYRDGEFGNCLTYAVGILDRYAKDLKIEDWEPSKIFRALPLPNIWIKVWHHVQSKNKRTSEGIS